MIDREDLTDTVTGDLDPVLSRYQRKELVTMTHEFTKEYILAADRKASILMTGLFGLLGLSFNAVDLNDLGFSAGVLVAFVFAAVCSQVALICAGFVIYPRKYKDTPQGFETGYIYWERIKSYESRQQFVDSIEEMDDGEKPLNELSKNVYNLADIASRKYTWLRRSMMAVGAMFYFGGIGTLYFASSNAILSVLVPSLTALAIVMVIELEDDRDAIGRSS